MITASSQNPACGESISHVPPKCGNVIFALGAGLGRRARVELKLVSSSMRLPPLYIAERGTGLVMRSACLDSFCGAIEKWACWEAVRPRPRLCA